MIPSLHDSPIDPMRGEPYAVNRVPSYPGTVLLIVRDHDGDLAMEVRVPDGMYTQGLVTDLETIIHKYDPEPVRRLELVK